MSTPNWILHLRTNSDAWNGYLSWLDQQRQIILEENPASWDAEKERQGAKKMLDKIKHLSTIDLKNEAQRAYALGVNDG